MPPMSKTIPELLAAVRECEKRAEGFAVLRGMVRSGDRTTCANDGYLEGHHVACDRLIPVIESIEPELVALSKVLLKENCKGQGTAEHDALLIAVGFINSKIRALLEGKTE